MSKKGMEEISDIGVQALEKRFQHPQMFIGCLGIFGIWECHDVLDVSSVLDLNMFSVANNHIPQTGNVIKRLIVACSSIPRLMVFLLAEIQGGTGDLSDRRQGAHRVLAKLAVVADASAH